MEELMFRFKIFNLIVSYEINLLVSGFFVVTDLYLKFYSSIVRFFIVF